MTSLIRSEIRRLTSRRLVKALVGLALLAITVTGVLVAVYSRGFERFSILNLPGVLEGTSFLLGAGGWVIGASFAGAEWESGSITTLLTWESRRTRVILTKVAVVAGGMFLIGVFAEALFALVLALVAATRGTTAGADVDLVRAVVTLGLRVAALSGIGAALGFSLAMVSRNTGAAIGIAFAYLAIVEAIMRGLRPGWRPWLLEDSASAFVLAGDPVIGRSVWSAAAVLLVYAGGFILIATTTFRIRDVT